MGRRQTILIFAAPVLYELLAEKGKGKGEEFQVEMDARLMEDRLLQPSNKDFITKTGEWIVTLKERFPGIEVRIYKQPGNMDFAIRFAFPSASDRGSVTEYKEILKGLRQDFLDRTDTSIQYQQLPKDL